MKSVLIAIQPKWVELIANGQKTIEVRKTVPKLEIPFKCYIYCTLSGSNEIAKDLPKWYREKWYEKKGKVIGEFVCDDIDEFQIKGAIGVRFKRFSALAETCLTVSEMREYAGDKPKLYGWHISELKIYDEPKELGEFVASTPKSKFRGHGDNLTRPPQSWCYVEGL